MTAEVQMKRIYLLGSFNMDLTIRAPYQPESGETLKGSDFMITPGGKGANQAYACANLGGDVVMSGCVGKDEFGDRLLTGLKSVGADVSRVRRADRTTGVAVITVIGGDNRIILDEGANGEVCEADAERLLADAKRGDYFMTQLENPLPAVGAALRIAKERGLFTVFNPAPANAAAREFVPYADLITPNRKELKLMSGKEGVEEGCAELLRAGAGAVLVTLGKEGSLYVSEKSRFRGPCIDVGEAIDTTAAGDTFCGALTVRLAEGCDMEKAVKFAALCSGIAVTRRGAQASIPDRKEADALFGTLKL